MKYFVTSLIPGALVVLTACSSDAVRNPDSFLYSVPVGSKLTLNKEITIPANRSRRYFQNGRAVLKKEIDIYYPHCSLLMNSPADHERMVKPAIFEIYKVVDDSDYTQLPLYVASSVFSYVDGPTIVGYASLYYLRSEKEPDVRSLECAQWDDPVNVRYLSINEVKKALGEYFELEVKG